MPQFSEPHKHISGRDYDLLWYYVEGFIDAIKKGSTVDELRHLKKDFNALGFRILILGPAEQRLAHPSPTFVRVEAYLPKSVEVVFWANYALHELSADCEVPGLRPRHWFVVSNDQILDLGVAPHWSKLRPEGCGKDEILLDENMARDHAQFILKTIGE